MKFVLLGLFVLILCFAIYSSKFNNPHKLIFIFGKKGSGKSTYMVKKMSYYLKKGWFVYTDMPGVSMNGIHRFKTLDLATFAPPSHSAIFLDEVGLSMDNRNFKSFPEGMRDFFALQRKYKCIVYVNSQSYDVDKKVRDRVDSMLLQSNIGNVIGISRPIIRKVTLTEASSQGESRIADQLKFDHFWTWKLTWLPRYFKYFDSFNAPARELIPSIPVVDGVSPKKELRLIRRNFHK